jgi:hypothetical protein
VTVEPDIRGFHRHNSRRDRRLERRDEEERRRKRESEDAMPPAQPTMARTSALSRGLRKAKLRFRPASGVERPTVSSDARRHHDHTRIVLRPSAAAASRLLLLRGGNAAARVLRNRLDPRERAEGRGHAADGVRLPARADRRPVRVPRTTRSARPRSACSRHRGSRLGGRISRRRRERRASHSGSISSASRPRSSCWR